MAILYDGKGNQYIIKEANGDSGTNELTYTGLSTTWLANAETSYNSLKQEVESLSYDAVPFFIQTDLHGRNNSPARWLHNKDKTIKNINLGDIVTDYYNETENTNYRESAMPVANLITVFGNHEANKVGNDIPTSYGLNYYYTDTTKGARMINQRGYFTARDDKYNVKYVVISPYYMELDGSRNGVCVNTDQMTWLLNELSGNDGYDIIVLMHQLFTDTHHNRSGTVQSWQDAPVVLEDLWNVIKNRRNKGSGTITDSDNVQHSYDFSTVKSSYLGSLHGHAHEELMLTENNTTAYAADWYGNENSCTFGVFDRKNNKLKIWKFGNTGVQDVLTLDI